MHIFLYSSQRFSSEYFNLYLSHVLSNIMKGILPVLYVISLHNAASEKAKNVATESEGLEYTLAIHPIIKTKETTKSENL